MESNNHHHDPSDDSDIQDESYEAMSTSDVEQPLLTKDELIARIDSLQQEADYQIALITETPEYGAIDATSDPDLHGFNYIAAYNQAFELIVRAHKALPGNVENERATSVPELYDDVAFYCPLRIRRECD